MEFDFVNLLGIISTFTEKYFLVVATYEVSIPMDTSEATRKKASKCNKIKYNYQNHHPKDHLSMKVDTLTW